MKNKAIKMTVLASMIGLIPLGVSAWDVAEENLNKTDFSYIVKLNENYNLNDLDFDMNSLVDVDIKSKRKIFNDFYAVRFNGYSDIDYETELLRLNSIISVEKDSIIRPNSTGFKSEPLYAQQLYMLSGHQGSSSIENVRENTRMTADKKPTIAILDTGIVGHIDVPNILSGYKFSSVYSNEDFYDNELLIDNDLSEWFKPSSDYRDFNEYWYMGDNGAESVSCVDSHGSIMASLIGAPVNGEGIAGIADVNFVIGKVLDTDCSENGMGTSGLVSDLVSGINWAANINDESDKYDGLERLDRVADIILISSSTYGDSTRCPKILQEVIDIAVGKGSIVVASAGNSSGDAGSVAPANCNNVITITSNDINGNISQFSNKGSGYVDYSVLGEDIYVPDINADSLNIQNRYKTMDGTSASAAIFTGMLGLLKHNFELFDASSAMGVFSENINSLDNNYGCFNSECGKGVADLERVVDDINIKLNFAYNERSHFGVANSGSCEQFMQDIVSEHINICSLYTVEIQNDNEIEGFQYRLFSKSKSMDLWSFSGSMRNTEMVNDYIITEDNMNNDKFLFIDDLNIDGFDYAISYCSADFCYPLKKLDFSNISESDFPLRCRS